MIQDEELGEAIWDNRYNADVKKSVGYNRFEKSRLQETFEKIYNGNVGEVFSTVDKKYLISIIYQKRPLEAVFFLACNTLTLIHI